MGEIKEQNVFWKHKMTGLIIPFVSSAKDKPSGPTPEEQKRAILNRILNSQTDWTVAQREYDQRAADAETRRAQWQNRAGWAVMAASVVGFGAAIAAYNVINEPAYPSQPAITSPSIAPVVR